MKKNILVALSLFLFTTCAQPQNTVSGFHSVSFNYLQLKEEMNYGLVFRGPGLSYAYSFKSENNIRSINFEVRLGFTYMQTRKVPAANINIVPVKLEYLFKDVFSDNLDLGPSFIADYNYQFNPDLHSGQSFWFTNYSLGGILQYNYRVSGQLFALSLNISFFGLTSRQPQYSDPYFWDLSAGDIMKFLHQDFNWGSWNKYNRSELEIRWLPAENSRLILSYSLNYMGYFDEPKLTIFNQSLKLIIRPKSK
jgi:hypothetical protein